MRKWLITLVVLVCGFSAAQGWNRPGSVGAWRNPSSVTNWSWMNDGASITLTNYTGPNAVVMPYMLDGLPVTGFGRTFRNNSAITSVMIVDSVTRVEESAFYGCTALTQVTIPNSVTRVEESAFYGCSGMTDVMLGSGVTNIGHGAFSHCSSLGRVTVPDRVTSINYNTFYYCTSLTDVEVGSITNISALAFANCTSLTNVSFSGNAPVCAETAYTNSPNVVNYVTQPTTIGWDATLASRPVVHRDLHSGGLLPDVSDSHDLGSSNRVWKSLYVGTGTVWFVGGATNPVHGVSVSDGGVLRVIEKGNPTNSTEFSTTTERDSLQASIAAQAVDISSGVEKDTLQDGALLAEVWARMMGDAADSLSAPGYCWDAFSSTSGVDDAGSVGHNYNADSDFWYSASGGTDYTADMVIGLKLDDDAASSTVTDDGPDSRHFTLEYDESAADTEDYDSSGQVDGSIFFDYVSDTIGVHAEYDNDTFWSTVLSDSYSITYWIRLNDGRALNNDHFGMKNNVPSYTGYCAAYFWNNGGEYTAVVGDGDGNNVRIGSASSVAPNGDTGWMHLAVVVDLDNDECRLYKDGQELSYSGTYPNDISSVNKTFTAKYPFYVGSKAFGDLGGSPFRCIDGYIDEFMVHDVALTGTQVEGIYDTTEPGMVSAIDAPSGGDMSLLSEAQTWDTNLTAITLYSLTTNDVYEADVIHAVSLDGKTNWTSVSCATPEGCVSGLYRYSGTATVAEVSENNLYWRTQTTNGLEAEFHALGIVGDSE